MTDVMQTNIVDIKNKYEDLIQKIFQELEDQKKEQVKIKHQILDIIEENNQACSSKSKISPLPTDDSNARREHEQLTCDAISNLKQQVDKLKEERKTIKQLWNTSQDTIANLETEILSYKNQLFKPNCVGEIKQRYCSAIKSLEEVIESQKNEICKQSKIIRSLTEENSQTNERLKELQKTLSNQEKLVLESKRLQVSNASLRHQLQGALKANCQLQSSTNIARVMIDDRFTREKNALEKLQEALIIAETAMVEKEEALKRELIVKEECETLAKTIGQVMEEAARKVEKDVDALKTQNEKKEQCLMRKYKEAIAEVDRQIKATRVAEARCFALEQKLRDVLHENCRLDRDLRISTQTIIDLEMQLDATEKLLNEDTWGYRSNSEQEQKLRLYLDCNQKLKERWKSTIEDMTARFGKEVQQLRNENAHLRAEINGEG